MGRVAIVGADGQLGTAFGRLLGDDAIAITKARLDLEDAAAIVGVLDEEDPGLVVNCAAYTQVDRAEAEEVLATRLNTDAVGIMADWAAAHGRGFLTFSTDYVFRGDADRPYVESSRTDPVNAYGRSKLGGERLAVDAGGLVVRTSWLISGSHPNFVATMIRLARQRRLEVVDDQHGCPTVAADLAVTSLAAARAGMTGLLHVTNHGSTTWFELARAAVGEAGLDADSITPCATADYPTDAARPAYSVLASERLEGTGLPTPPHWRESLPEVVAEIMTWI